MKVKILTGIIVIAISATIIISTTSRSQNTAPEQAQSFSQDNQQQLLKPINEPKSEKNQQVANPKVSLKELEGHINKEYGIREDILRYIEKQIPNNEMAKKVAIKYAQKWNFIYYKATPEEAIKEAAQQLIILDCLRYALKTDKPMAITKGIRMLMHNTPERDKYLWQISTKYFGRKIIEQDQISEEKLKNICETEKY
jgi:hypothetical protein